MSNGPNLLESLSYPIVGLWCNETGKAPALWTEPLSATPHSEEGTMVEVVSPRTEGPEKGLNVQWKASRSAAEN